MKLHLAQLNEQLHVNKLKKKNINAEKSAVTYYSLNTLR